MGDETHDMSGSQMGAAQPLTDGSPVGEPSSMADALPLGMTTPGAIPGALGPSGRTLEEDEAELKQVERFPDREAKPIEVAGPDDELKKDWFIIKVQSNREESIKDALLRRVKVAGMDEYFGDVIVPTETVTEFKGGKKRVVKRKLYPGYIVVNMALTDDSWFLVRETPGIGDFTGAAGKPSPMRQQEVDKIVVKEKAVETESPTLSIAFKAGARVKINEGTFENFEGEVSAIDATNGRVTVMINIFGRSTPVELEYWQVESL